MRALLGGHCALCIMYDSIKTCMCGASALLAIDTISAACALIASLAALCIPTCPTDNVLSLHRTSQLKASCSLTPPLSQDFGATCGVVLKRDNDTMTAHLAGTGASASKAKHAAKELKVCVPATAWSHLNAI